MTEFLTIAALVVSMVIIMIGQADSGRGGILLFGLACWAATFAWIVFGGLGT